MTDSCFMDLDVYLRTKIASYLKNKTEISAILGPVYFDRTGINQTDISAIQGLLKLVMNIFYINIIKYINGGYAKHVDAGDFLGVQMKNDSFGIDNTVILTDSLSRLAPKLRLQFQNGEEKQCTVWIHNIFSNEPTCKKEELDEFIALGISDGISFEFDMYTTDDKPVSSLQDIEDVQLGTLFEPIIKLQNPLQLLEFEIYVSLFKMFSVIKDQKKIVSLSNLKIEKIYQITEENKPEKKIQITFIKPKEEKTFENYFLTGYNVAKDFGNNPKMMNICRTKYQGLDRIYVDVPQNKEDFMYLINNTHNHTITVNNTKSSNYLMNLFDQLNLAGKTQLKNLTLVIKKKCLDGRIRNHYKLKGSGNTLYIKSQGKMVKASSIKKSSR